MVAEYTRKTQGQANHAGLLTQRFVLRVLIECHCRGTHHRINSCCLFVCCDYKDTLWLRGGGNEIIESSGMERKSFTPRSRSTGTHGGAGTFNFSLKELDAASQMTPRGVQYCCDRMGQTDSTLTFVTALLMYHMSVPQSQQKHGYLLVQLGVRSAKKAANI